MPLKFNACTCSRDTGDTKQQVTSCTTGDDGHDLLAQQTAQDFQTKVLITFCKTGVNKASQDQF